MADCDQDSPVGNDGAGASFGEIYAAFGILPDMVGAAELERLNSALAEMFGRLHEAARRRPTSERAAARLALEVATCFVMRFKSGLNQNLHMPLLGLTSALQALDDNMVEPLLKPTPAPAGGRAPDSPQRQALVGFAVGAVGRLRWTGLTRLAAHEAVADALHKIGIMASRGSGHVTSRTVREWCARVAADVSGRSLAARNANLMMTDKWAVMIKARSPQGARKFILDSLAGNVRNLNFDGVSSEKPAKPPS
jgi:hypothetical protein